MVEANPEAFLRAFDHVAKRVEAARKRRTVTVTSKYNSRTDILRSALSLDIPSLSPFPFPLPSLPHLPFFSSPSPNSSSSSPSSSSPPSSTSSSPPSSRPSFPLRIRAVAEGRPSAPFTRFSIAPEIGPLRLRWDRPRLVPSFGATLHSGDNSLVQIFHDLQVRALAAYQVLLSRGATLCARHPLHRFCIPGTTPSCKSSHDLQERPSHRTAPMVGWWARSMAYRWPTRLKVPQYSSAPPSLPSLHTRSAPAIERPSHRTALMVGWWARSMAYRALLSLKLPACHVDMLWVDFPRGEFLMNRVNGVKASLFLPCHPLRGVLQVEGRTADTATVGFAYQHPLGTRVTPSYSLADRGLSVEVLQPITVRQLGPAVKPEAQIRFKTTMSGTRQGWEMETTRFLGTNEIVGGAAEASQGGLAVSVGYKAGVAPVAFFTLFGGGRRRRKTAVTGKGAGYQLRLEFPPSNLRRAVISWDATHGIDF
ncbi:unnamed protein product [Closterium sp. Naga37s-1]|nr:unnamed protein product [Closterium sp. Naga37s-1]